MSTVLVKLLDKALTFKIVLVRRIILKLLISLTITNFNDSFKKYANQLL